jgi:hypothetical protein
MVDILNLSDEEMIEQGYLVIEHRFNSKSFIPTQKYRDACGNPYPNGVPVLYQTSKGRFLKSGSQVKLLGSGEAPQLNVIHEGTLEDFAENSSEELLAPIELPEKF